MSVRNGSAKGFTLVELSIVLVVIGLLIGGILMAQSMISTSKVNAVAMQIGQFDAGVMNFKTRYNYLPGDAPSFGGNGDGMIESYPPTLDVSKFDCEIANFWSNVDPQTFPPYAGTFPCNFGVGGAVVTTEEGKSVPISKLGKHGSFFIASGVTTTQCCDHTGDITSGNYYTILDSTQLQTPLFSNYYQPIDTTSNNSPIKPADLLALDKKIDDGIANLGSVKSGEISYGDPNFVTALVTCSQGATYQVQNISYECTPLIRIGAQAGDPQ